MKDELCGCAGSINADLSDCAGSINADLSGCAGSINAESSDVAPFIARARRRFPRAWCPWSPVEEQALRALFELGASIAQMSDHLGRGQGGIRSHLRAMGLDSAPEPYRRKTKEQPVPQMERVPQDWGWEPDLKCCRETAGFWNVSCGAFSRALNALDEVLRRIFVWRYGLSGRCCFSVEGIADALDVKPGRVSQLQALAENKMRLSLEAAGCNPLRVSWRETVQRCIRR